MKCRICGNSDNNTVYDVREMMMGSREVFTYFQCHVCKCLQIKEFPPNISAFYENAYYSLQEKAESNGFKDWLKYKRSNYAVFNRSLLGKIAYKLYPQPNLHSLSHLKLTKEMSILDVGCGRGKILRCLHQLGFQDLTGIDPFLDEETLEIGKNDVIFKKHLHEVEGQWSLIMLHHSFEHMPEPLDILKNISTHLSQDGYCLIRIPVVCSKAWEKFRENWIQIDAPRHYFIHSPRSMQYLIDQTNLQLQQIIYDSTAFQFWGSIQYKNDIPLEHENSYKVNPRNSMFSKRDIRHFSQKADRLNGVNQGDQAIFILQK